MTDVTDVTDVVAVQTSAEPRASAETRTANVNLSALGHRRLAAFVVQCAGSKAGERRRLDRASTASLQGECRAVSLLLRNLVFTAVVPGAGGLYVPWLILTHGGPTPAPGAWYALVVIAGGIVLYAACVLFFGAVGRGTPGVWGSPRSVVTVGPYRWVRNPIYLSALLIVSGEAWLFLSPQLLLYAVGLAVAFHLLVVGFEEPRLRRRFGVAYETYLDTVPRWVPRRPRA